MEDLEHNPHPAGPPKVSALGKTPASPASRPPMSSNPFR